ncbi:MAG: twin-arginine translocase TatA/TatE family subunit [Nitrososphaerales archaeon]
MAIDDPIVWILIVVVVLILFGASRIPKFAKALGEARREFSKGSQGDTSPVPQAAPPVPAAAAPSQPAMSQVLTPDDPLYMAAQNEGIDIRGKTKSEIATELAWKLSKKQP